MEKLVRDGMPLLCKEKAGDGWTEMNYRIAQDAELFSFLLDKLVEEALEVKNSTSFQNAIEELADLKEVMLAIQTAMGIKSADVEQVRQNKHAQRGGFLGGVIWDGKK